MKESMLDVLLFYVIFMCFFFFFFFFFVFVVVTLNYTTKMAYAKFHKMYLFIIAIFAIKHITEM